jgi:hypothetical protein
METASEAIKLTPQEQTAMPTAVGIGPGLGLGRNLAVALGIPSA